MDQVSRSERGSACNLASRPCVYCMATYIHTQPGVFCCDCHKHTCTRDTRTFMFCASALQYEIGAMWQDTPPVLRDHYVCCCVVYLYVKNSQGLVQSFLLGLLSKAGRHLVSSVMRQGGSLYPPTAPPLKDVVTKYTSLTGADKWLLASIMPLGFRPVLRSVTAMVRFDATELFFRS